MKIFALRLAQLRESRDLSKKDLANILHVSDSCISQYEKEKSVPGYDTLLSIARYFDVSVDFLLGNEDKQMPVHMSSPFSDGISYAGFMSECNKLSPAKRRALLTVLKAFQEE